MKHIIIVILSVFFSIQAWGQVPQKMSYQAVIRDGNGELISNQVISVKISILKGSFEGQAVYRETQNPETNSNGLMSLEIGGEDANIILGHISEVNWSNDIYFIKTETDPNGGSDYTISGTSQLLSVPYALHAETAESLTGEITYNETDPIFESSVAAAIQEQDTANWNNKLDSFTEADPEFNSSLASGITETDTINWNNKLDSFTEVDPEFNSSLASGITETDTINWNNKLDSFTEADPEFNSSAAAGITEADTDNWNNKLEEEVDGSITNEIQSFTVSRTGDTLYIDKGNFVIIPGISQANLPEEQDPVFLDVQFSLEKVAEGTNVTLTFIVDDPYYTTVNFLDYYVMDAFNDQVHSFNGTVTFTETDPGVFEYSETFLIGNDQVNGEYKAVNIYVTNEINSYIYYDEFVYFTINN